VAKGIMEQLVRYGVVHRGYLGVSVSELEPEVASRLGLENQTGVVVAKVLTGTPAAKAGIEAGDIITSIGGKSVKDGRDLQHAVGQLVLNKPVEIALIRDGKSKLLTATIEEQPDNYGVTNREPRTPQQPKSDKEEVSVDKVGIEVAELTPELGEKYGYKEDAKGVLITDVQPGSVAAEAGLRKGMLIAKIDRKAVTSADKVRETLDKASLAKGTLLQVEAPPSQGGGTAYIVLKAETADK
jgi:serine protease Do